MKVKKTQLKKCQNTQSDTFITIIQSLAFVGFSVRLNKNFTINIVEQQNSFDSWLRKGTQHLC